MRGVVSAAMTGALDRLGFAQCFDIVAGASAGAINAAALLAGEAQRATAAYCGPLASRSFVNPLRALRGKPVIDVNTVLDYVAGLDAAGHERVTGSEVKLLCLATDVESARPVVLQGIGPSGSYGTRSSPPAGCHGPAGRPWSWAGAGISTAG